MLYLKPKQKRVVDLVNNPNIHTIVLIGAVGTGKTDIASHIGISIAYTYKKTYWTVFRQNISIARRTIIPSYLDMMDKMNLIEGEDYKQDKQLHTINFLHNKSQIAFVEADVTKDREGKKIKGINATGNHIDEADELARVMFIQAISRRGRKNEMGQPSLSIITMNPNDTYLKEMYYDPYRNNALEDGVAVVEFDIADSWQSEVDIAEMKKNPRSWVERYINNNWEYADDENSLFKYRYFDSNIVNTIDNNAIRSIGYDVARTGTDKSVISLWWGKTLIDIVIIKDKDDQITTDEQATRLIRYMIENAVTAGKVAVDAIGVGVGVIDYAKSTGNNFKEFVSGAKPTIEKYDNLRSQVAFEFAQGLEKGEIKIYEGCSYRNELLSEAMMHNYYIDDKKFKLESKDEVKKRMGGASPDIFDAVIIGLSAQLELDKKNSSKRIIY